MGSVELRFGDVTKKDIASPNHFVSHMIEHIAWRLGTEVKVDWQQDNWTELGYALGHKIGEFTPRGNEAVTIGLMDDSSAKVRVDLKKSGLKILSVPSIDLGWFLKLRSEQLTSGQPLVQLLQGLSSGFGGQIEIKVCSVGDPHHAWEAIFRGVGSAFSKVYTPELKSLEQDSVAEPALNYAQHIRQTAESTVIVRVDFTREQPNSFSFSVDKSTDIGNFSELLCLLAEEAGLSMQIDFNAKNLSSSHVVCEDTGLVLGRALLSILTARMEKMGVNGAGSSLQIAEKLDTNQPRVAISVEGRKFWSFVPLTHADYRQFQREFLIGQNVLGNLRSEDLDDFFDGLSGGMNGSIMVQIEEWADAESAWLAIFKGLGVALKEVYTPNPFRKGVPPGVKATLS